MTRKLKDFNPRLNSELGRVSFVITRELKKINKMTTWLMHLYNLRPPVIRSCWVCWESSRLRESQTLWPLVTSLLMLQSPSLVGIVVLQCVCVWWEERLCCDWLRSQPQTPMSDVSLLIPLFFRGCFFVCVCVAGLGSVCEVKLRGNDPENLETRWQQEEGEFGGVCSLWMSMTLGAMSSSWYLIGCCV